MNKESLFDDASTLLMFSKSNNSERPETAERNDDTMKHDDNITKDDIVQYTDDTKKEESTWPVSNYYIVDPDAGIITCICGFDDDDGFTIQCDHCNRWQHAKCYNINNLDNVPDDYLCNSCQPRNLDIKRARRLQLQRLRRPENDDKKNENDDNVVNDELDSIQTNDDVENVSTPVSASAVSDIENKKKMEYTYMSAKDTYDSMYLPLDSFEVDNKYVDLFLQKHFNDDFILSVKSFKPIPTEVKSYSDSARVFPGFTKLGLFIKESCYGNDLINEYSGIVNFKKNYLIDNKNHYRILGTTKPKILFHNHWPIFIDSRLSGNLTRYIRRACKPNVDLTTVKVDDEIKFILKATRDIDEDEELTLPWNWDSKHPILKIINNTNSSSQSIIDSLNDSEKFLLINSIDSILRYCDCACGNNNKDCNLFKIKKYSINLCRSIKSKMNNRYKINEILNQYQGKRRRPPPILNRLINESFNNKERAAGLINQFNSEKLTYLEYQESKKTGIDNKKVHKIENNVSDGTTDNVKPYKWKLSNKIQDKVVVNVKITNALEYNESKVNDILKLSIPINLNVVHHNIHHHTTETEIDDNDTTITDNNNINNINTTINSTTEITQTTLTPTTEKPQVFDERILKNNNNNSSSDLAEQRKPLKKKLSFADYRKKLNK